MIRTFLYLSIVLTIWDLPVLAQHSSQLGRFSIGFSRACAPATVNITSLDNFGNIARQYFYELDSTERLDTFYTYTEPGIYKIVQFIGEDVVPKSDTLTFEVLSSPIPSVDIFHCSEHESSIEIGENFYDSYQIVYNTDTLSLSDEQTRSSLQLSDPPGSVFVKGIFDQADNGSCSSTRVQIPTYEAPIQLAIDSISIHYTCLNLANVSVFAVGQESTLFQLEMSVANAPFEVVYIGEFIDTLILTQLPISYLSEPCFRLSSLNACNRETVEFTTQCSHGLANNQEGDQIFGSYSGDNIKLHLPRTENLYVVNRRPITGTYSVIDTVSSSFLDYIPTINRQYEYRIDKVDTCGNVFWSESLVIPFQKLLSKDRERNVVLTDQMAYNGPQDPQSSFLLLYNADSTAVQTIPLLEEFTLRGGIGKVQKWRAAYVLPNDSISYSNELTTSYHFMAHVPGAFTPNGDGLNDVLHFLGSGTEVGSLTIYDRWGKAIYNSDNLTDGWSGKTNNGDAPAGSYRYKIVMNINGDIQSQVGSFVLIRN